MLEAGPSWFASRDSKMMTPNWATPHRGASIHGRPFGEFDACDGGWEIDGEPYTKAPGTQFSWWRARMLGGRTNHWGRISLRFGPDDFRGKSIDGLGDDWPISYDDVKPYYDNIDRFIGLYGSNEGLRNHPDGIFTPPPKPRCHELLVKKASDKLNITCIPARLSVITKPLPGRQACHYCGQCNRGCQVKANFSSPDVLIAPALQTGKLTLLTNAMAREVTVGPDGLATGVSYINKNTGADEHVRAKVVVLAASAMETARLLLNSKSDGVRATGSRIRAASSGSISLTRRARASPDTSRRWKTTFRTITTAWAACTCTCRGGSTTRSSTSRAAITSRCTAAPDSRARDLAAAFNGKTAAATASKLKADYRKYYGASIGFDGRGEMIPNENSYCELDPNDVDRFGIPVLRFHWKFSDYEINQAKHMQETFRSLIVAMGGDADVADAVARSELRTRRGRNDHPRARRRAHGRGSNEVGRERELSGARREEPVRHRRQSVRLAGRQESDVDDSRAVVAHEPTTSPHSERRGRYERRNPNATSRARDALLILGTVPVSAALGGQQTQASSGAARRDCAQRRRRRSSSSSTSGRRCTCSSTTSFPRTSIPAARPTRRSRSTWTFCSPRRTRT